MTELIRIGSKIFNPRAIILCEPVFMWVYDNPDDDEDGRKIEALKICLMGQHDLIITPEEWQGVKRMLNIMIAVPGELPPRPAPSSADIDDDDLQQQFIDANEPL